MKQLLIFLVSCLVFLGELKAQQDVKHAAWSMGLTTGITSPLHDVRRAEFFEIGDMRYNLGAHVTHWFWPFLGLRAQMVHGSVTGEINQQAYISRLNLSGAVESQTSYFELSTQAIVNFSGMGFWPVNRAKADRKWNVFAALGLGMNDFNARIKDLTSGQFLTTKNFGRAKGRVLVVPVGLGVSYKVSPQFHIDLQGNVHFLNTDGFDALVVQKADGAVNEPSFGRNLDRYSTINLSFVFTLSNKNKASRYWSSL